MWEPGREGEPAQRGEGNAEERDVQAVTRPRWLRRWFEGEKGGRGGEVTGGQRGLGTGMRGDAAWTLSHREREG